MLHPGCDYRLWLISYSSISTSKKITSRLVLSPGIADTAVSQASATVSPLPLPFSPLSNILGTLTTIQNGTPVKDIVPTVEPPTWTEYYRKLARALAGEGNLPASGVEAGQVIRLIELAQESSKVGKTIDV